jgi:hypothetical protein
MEKTGVRRLLDSRIISKLKECGGECTYGQIRIESRIRRGLSRLLNSLKEQGVVDFEFQEEDLDQTIIKLL